MKRILPALFVFISAAPGPSAQGADAPAPAAPDVLVNSGDPAFINQIQHVVVIYQENWSYDGLYGSFPDPDRPDRMFAFGATMLKPQIDITGNIIPALPPALDNEEPPAVVDARFPYTQPITHFDMEPYARKSVNTGDIVHAFYTEQLQIDSGNMDRFVAWTNNPGLTTGGFDATGMAEGRLATKFLMCDDCFHSAFGGSFLNHQFFIAAQAPVWPNALTARKVTDLLTQDSHAGAPAFITIATLETAPDNNLLPVPALSLNATATFTYPTGNNWPAPLAKKNVKFDNALSINPTTSGGKDYYAVNTVQPSSWPFETSGPFLPLQTNNTIGDLLTANKVSWKWYSGGWDQAVAGNPDPSFQTHHQPFNYYANYAPGKPGRAHLVDVNQFAVDLAGNNLPAVSFVKFQGEFNEHPGYADLESGQQTTADLVKLIQDSSAWPTTLIIITYDENGGRWDHVAPPESKDGWGPGTRVPMILISPFVRRGQVDNTQYETVSILRFIEDRWQLGQLGPDTRDNKVNSFANAFAKTVDLSK